MKISIKNKDWIEIALHISFWASVFYTLLSLTVPHIRMLVDHNGTIVDNDISYSLKPKVFIEFGFLILLFYTNSLWLLKRAIRYKNRLIQVILPLFWFTVIFLVNNYLDTSVTSQIRRDEPIVDIVQQLPNRASLTLRPFRSDSVRPAVTLRYGARHDRFIIRDHPEGFAADGFSNIVFLIFIIIFGLSIAYFFLKEWVRTEKFRSQLAAIQLDTEVKFLKSQVNPHFLFNTLNNLFSMAQDKGNDELADGISKLSGMMRYMLYESNAESVPLSKEIIYLQECITLNKLRYAEDEVIVKFDYPVQTGGITIAPMLFIPFIENAFKHGVTIGQASIITIGISISGQNLIFTCENTNYNAIKKMDIEKNGIGLENVKRRLELLYPGKHRLQITETNGMYMINLEINLA